MTRNEVMMRAIAGGITDYVAANGYLVQHFVPDFNRRFTVMPAQVGSAFVPARHTPTGHGEYMARRRGVRDPAFRCEGEFWTITYQGTVCHLKDSKGLRFLAHLLKHPGERLPALLLASVGEVFAVVVALEHKGTDTVPRPFADERARVKVSRGIRNALQRIESCHPALAAHLGATVRTGKACVYLPDPRLPVIQWPHQSGPATRRSPREPRDT